MVFLLCYGYVFITYTHPPSVILSGSEGSLRNGFRNASYLSMIHVFFIAFIKILSILLIQKILVLNVIYKCVLLRQLLN